MRLLEASPKKMESWTLLHQMPPPPPILRTWEEQQFPHQGCCNLWRNRQKWGDTRFFFRRTHSLAWFWPGPKSLPGNPRRFNNQEEEEEVFLSALSWSRCCWSWEGLDSHLVFRPLHTKMRWLGCCFEGDSKIYLTVNYNLSEMLRRNVRALLWHTDFSD